MKKFLSLVLSLALCCSLIPQASAASSEGQQAAQSLYELGLFSGTGTDANGAPIFDLDRAPTRHEAVTMLVRLLGKGEEAEKGTWNTPFTDMADWATPYVGYAYTNGLTAGTSATTYGGDEPVTASQYITFVLRALGYETGTDFQWDKAWVFSDQIGLTDGRYNSGTATFTRSDVAIISKAALNTTSKVGNILMDKLQTDEAQDLQGIWKTTGKDYDEEYIFNGNTYTSARIMSHDYNGKQAVSFCSGNYKLVGSNFEFSCTHTYTSYAYTTNEFNGKLENTLQRTETLEFLNQNSFQYGGNTYYKISNSELTQRVKEELGQYLLTSEITDIRQEIQYSANCMAVGLTYMVTAGRYDITASNSLLGSAAERRAAAKKAAEFVDFALENFATTKRSITNMKSVVADKDGTLYYEIRVRCDQILTLCDDLLSLSCADTPSLKAVSSNGNSISKLLTEISDLMN